MSDILESDGNPNRNLTAEDFNKQGDITNKSAELALVVGFASNAEGFIANKQWNLLWRDSDLLMQSPRPMSVYENTYVLEPNVQRFTVAKVVNSIVPQLVKGLFYANPPMILRPRPGTSQDVVDAKSALFAYLLDDCKFQRDTKWGMEQMALFGTGIWKWGVERKKVERSRRKATQQKLEQPGQDPEQQLQNPDVIALDVPPEIETKEVMVTRPFFEYRPITKVLVDGHTEVGDIREANAVADIRYMDYYQVKGLLDANKTEDGKLLEGWVDIPNLIDLWLPPSGNNVAPTLASELQAEARDIVHHAVDVQIQTSPDPLAKKLEVLEYWDRKRKILVLQRKKVIYSGENHFKQIPFLSANWWNRPRAFYGMGLGLIVGQNQRVDQGTINAILKILSFGVNPIYLRSRAANSPTQMLRTGLGRILTVDGELDNSYRLLETPKVPTEVWSALQESQSATESSSGADQMLVQGSTAGPRTSMGRTAGGAATLAGASATRLDGPLDNFITQVFEPFLYILDSLVFHYMSDAEIVQVLGEELGADYTIDMQKFHDGMMEFETLAGSALAAKRMMAQSLPLITQIFENPAIQQSLSDINEEYIDFKVLLDMWMESSEWKNRQDVIKKMTPEMIARKQAASDAAQQQAQMQSKTTLENQKFQNKQALQQQATDDHIKRDVVTQAFKANEVTLAKTGMPSEVGLGSF